MCPVCDRPMALFAQLDLATAPTVLHPALASGLLQAFFCIDMDCVHGTQEGDPFATNHLLRVIDPAGDSGSAGRAPAGERAPPHPGVAADEWPGPRTWS